MTTVVAVVAVAAAAEAPLERLFDDHYRSLVGLARLLLDDTGAAEEVVQEAFARLATGRSRLRDPERPPIDVTATPDGELLYLDADGTLFVVDDGPPEVLGRRFVDAAW